ERATLAVVHRHQLDRAIEDRLDILDAAPEIRDRLRGREQLLHLVMRDVGRRRPERKHVLGKDVVVERLQGGFAVRELVNIHSDLPRHENETFESLTLRQRRVNQLNQSYWLTANGRYLICRPRPAIEKCTILFDRNAMSAPPRFNHSSAQPTEWLNLR